MSCPAFRRSLLAAVLLTATAAGRADDPPAGRVDRHGDPLPDGAVARLGTARFRAAGYGAALSPDGKTLAVFADRDAVSLVDAASGREVRRVRADLAGGGGLVFSPDGRLAVAGFGGLRLFDAASGECVATLREVARGRPGALAFSGDGKVLAVGADAPGRKAPVTVVEAVTGKKLGELTPESDYQGGVALSGDGKRAVTWGRTLKGGNGEANFAQLWDVTAGKEERRVVVEGSMVQTAVLSPDGRLLAVWEYGGAVSTWDATTGEAKRRWAVPMTQPTVFGFSPDGKVLAAGTADGTVRLWDQATGRGLPCRPGPTCAPFGLAFLPGGKVLAAGLDQQAVRLWDVTTGEERTPRGGHRAAVDALAFSADGRSLVSAGQDGLRRWDLPAGTESGHVLIPSDERYGPRNYGTPCTGMSPDGRFVTCGERHGGPLRVVETAGGRDLFAVPAGGRIDGPAAAFSADGGRVAVLGQAGRGNAAQVRILDVASGEVLRSFPAEAGELGNCLAVSPGGRLLASASLSLNRGAGDRGVLQVWDADTGKSLWRVEGAGGRVGRLAFSPDGTVLAAPDGAGGVRLWEAAGGTPLREFRGPDNAFLTALAFSPDGRTLAAACVDRQGAAPSVQVWELASGKVRCEFRGHRGALAALAYSPDGRTLATGGSDTTVLLWDLTVPPGLAVRPGTRLTPEEAAGLWADLDGDARTAHRAMARLAADPPTAAALVRRELKPAAGAALGPGEVERLLADLDDESFEVREKASVALGRAGRPVRPALQQALAADPGPEKRRRLQELLDALTEAGPPPEMVRPTRAVELLERVATPEARRSLAALADGAAEAPLTVQARAALRRLEARAPRP
jgi:WD40 repeat protein